MTGDTPYDDDTLYINAKVKTWYEQDGIIAALRDTITPAVATHTAPLVFPYPRLLRALSSLQAGPRGSHRGSAGVHVYWGASGLPTIGTHKLLRIPPLVPTSHPHHNVTSSTRGLSPEPRPQPQPNRAGNCSEKMNALGLSVA